MADRSNLRLSVVAPLMALAVLAAACSGDSGAETPAAVAPPTKDWTPVGQWSGGSVPAGRGGMAANGRPDTPWAVVDVPEGFVNFDHFALLNASGPHFHGLGYWTVSEVHRHPCERSRGQIDAGTTVADLVAALQDQRLTRTTEPAPVVISGHDGLYLELRVPDHFAFADCPSGYTIWASEGGGERYFEHEGQMDQLWVLDVDGDVVVLQATGVPGLPDSAWQRLGAMVESVEFVVRDS